jgi:hypothetical protein
MGAADLTILVSRKVYLFARVAYRASSFALRDTMWRHLAASFEAAGIARRLVSSDQTFCGGLMQRLYWILLSFLLCGSALAQETADRMFFPRDTFYGYAQFDIAPPHNEIDPNLCSALAGNYGGVNAPCSDFARYMISGLLEVRPFGRGILSRLMVYGEPRFLFGKNIPQTLYTWSFDAIGVEHSWGAAIYLGKGFEFRATQHFLFDRLGARDKNLGTADLGPNGPWGRYNTFGVRKTFGRQRW